MARVVWCLSLELDFSTGRSNVFGVKLLLLVDLTRAALVPINPSTSSDTVDCDRVSNCASCASRAGLSRIVF